MHELICVSGLMDHLTRISSGGVREEITRVHRPARRAHRGREPAAQGRGRRRRDLPLRQGRVPHRRPRGGSAIAMTEAVFGGRSTTATRWSTPPATTPCRRPASVLHLQQRRHRRRHAQAVLGIERLAIVDWDVHHGNGAQAIFADDPSVLTVRCTRTVASPRTPGWSPTGGPAPATATTSTSRCPSAPATAATSTPPRP